MQEDKPFNIQNNEVKSFSFIVQWSTNPSLFSLFFEMCRMSIKFNDAAWTFYAHTIAHSLCHWSF